MVSGSVKKEMGSGEAKSSTTIPFFLEGEECLKIKTRQIPLLGRRIGSEEFEGEVYFVFSERNSAGLIREIGANLDDVLASGANLPGPLLPMRMRWIWAQGNRRNGTKTI